MNGFHALGLAAALGALAAGPSSSAWGQAQGAAERAREPSAPAPEPGGGSSWLDSVYLDLAPEFETGKYGTRRRSDFLYFPATLGYDRDGVVAGLTVPYVISRTSANVVLIGGRPVRVGRGTRPTRTHGGVGDLLADAGYYLFEEGGGMPSLLLEGEVKVPTADDERGLGTGSYDETFRASSGVTFAKRLKLSADAGYTRIGQPEDVPRRRTEYHDTLNLGGGVGYAFAPKNELWVRLDASSRITRGTPPYELLTFEWSHYFDDESRLSVELGFGLTDAAPGMTFTVGYKFWF